MDVSLGGSYNYGKLGDLPYKSGKMHKDITDSGGFFYFPLSLGSVKLDSFRSKILLLLVNNLVFVLVSRC